ncbi:MAG TPA: hypothetical protein VNT26_08900, partial [Candidatus Sulfotelmatobacter sp.]|nr:hypothetical protein [Candidatus Sulfotelmatobacter sp.]
LALHEFVSHDANVRFIRHIGQTSAAPHDAPLWKTIRPALTRITIDRVNLDGIKLLYRYADTSQSMKLQFDTCYAKFKDIRIDSTGTADTGRIFFAREVEMRFRDLKFRSPDSVNKLKAEQIVYSSRRRTLEVQDFKIQPTRKDPVEFYAWIRRQKVMNTVEFDRAVFSGLRLDRFLHNETLHADSLYLEGLLSSLFLDKTQPLDLQSKIGQYPHQVLLRAPRRVVIPKVVVRDAALVYTERGAQTGEKGALTLEGISGVLTNVTNDPDVIEKHNRMEARLQGRILGASPVAMHLTFFLDSANGHFAANGRVQNVTATQLNALAGSLASTRLQSFDMQQLDFDMTGDDFTGRGSVRMRYNNLSVVLQKVDEETGVHRPRKFLTRLLNRHVLQASNPAGGAERTAEGVVYNRLTSQSFFGLIWKTIFTGMQEVMMKNPAPTSTAARRIPHGAPTAPKGEVLRTRPVP